jgi:hypothetical protein
MLTEKMDTAVNKVSSRKTVKEPRMPMPPMTSGKLAAVTEPKITSSKMSSTGSDKLSARPMSLLVWLVMVSSVGTSPPTSVRSMGAASLVLMRL